MRIQIKKAPRMFSKDLRARLEESSAGLSVKDLKSLNKVCNQNGGSLNALCFLRWQQTLVDPTKKYKLTPAEVLRMLNRCGGHQQVRSFMYNFDALTGAPYFFTKEDTVNLASYGSYTTIELLVTPGNFEKLKKALRGVAEAVGIPMDETSLRRKILNLSRRSGGHNFLHAVLNPRFLESAHLAKNKTHYENFFFSTSLSYNSPEPYRSLLEKIGLYYKQRKSSALCQKYESDSVLDGASHDIGPVGSASVSGGGGGAALPDVLMACAGILASLAAADGSAAVSAAAASNPHRLWGKPIPAVTEVAPRGDKRPRGDSAGAASKRARPG